MFGPAWRLLFVRWLPLVVLCAHMAAGNVSPLKIDAAVDDLSTMVEDLEIYSEYHGVTHRRSLHKTALTAVETERNELNNTSGVAGATALKLPTLKNRAMVDTYAVRTRPRLPQTRRRLRLSPFMFTSPLPSRFRAVFAGGGRGGWQRAAHQPQHGSQIYLVRSPPPSPPLHELRGQWRLQIRREELLLVRRRVLRHLRAPGPPPHPHRWLPNGIGEG